MLPDDGEKQTTLLDTSGQDLNALWVDEKQPLFIPNNPMHWKAHKLQVLLSILTKQAQNSPGQFSSKNYLSTLQEYTNTIEIIRGTTNGNMGSGKMDSERAERREEAAMGAGNASGVDIGISTDNPFARQGADPS